MQIDHALAEQVVARVQAILKRDVLLADPNGTVLAGGDELPGSFVNEALQVRQTGRPQTSTFHDRPIRWWPFQYEDHTIGVFGIFLEAGSITPETMTLLQGLAEVIVYQHFLFEHVQSTDTVRATFLKELLTSPSLTNPEDSYRQADILQLPLRGPQAMMIIEIVGTEAEAESVSHQLSELLQTNRGTIVSPLGSDRFALIKAIGGEGQTTLNTIRFLTEQGKQVLELVTAKWPDKTITLGIGQYYPELAGLRKSFQDAKLALEVGVKVWGRSKFYHIKQVGMFITLANTSQDRKAELAHQILSPLLRDEQLFKTVQAFLADGLNLTNAAEHLHVHRNTLIYRLDKTKKLIGLDPRHFDDALQIKLGLMFYQPTA